MTLIVLLLIDGLGYEYVNPNSFWAQNSTAIRNSEPTITAPNWATILSGLSPKEHGVLDNKSHALPSYRFPHSTIFDDVKSSLMISDWKMMYKFSSKCDFEYGRVWSRALNNLGRYAKKYDLIVVNYSRLDSVAHELKWGSAEYKVTMEYIDKQTRSLYQELLHLKIPFVLLGTSDHGGHEDDHEEAHLRAVHQVPFLCVNHYKKKMNSIKSTMEVRRVIQNIQKV